GTSVAGASVAGTSVAGASVAGTAPSHDGAFTVRLENDAFTGTDNNYTNGLGFTWTTGAIDRDAAAGFESRWTRFWAFLPFVADPGFDTYASWSLGHEVHTPTDISIPDPPQDDQPYSGALYVDSALHARNDRWGHTWTLRTGIVGPSSHAEQIQRELHELNGSKDPQGWETQLPDEPLINADYTAMYLWREGSVGESASWRVVPVGSVSIGNYFTGVGAGVYGEIGWNLIDAFRGTAPRHGFNGAPMTGAGPVESWSLTFFAGVEAYGVAHYLPLDGTVFEDSRSVPSNPFTSALSTGLTLRRKGLVVSLTQSFFTETFPAERDRAAFTTFSLSWYRRAE
ncbi:MAG: lipid A deacylase LpxR family protein, partial [Gammaproteobacteria bacterium]|nr:lipid A deacylase LpxR family protein [Gammaproteobacteria bacterium]